MNVCHPIAATWDPTIPGGKCDVDVLVAAAYFVSAMSLITDFSCAILPAVILWNLQMNKRTKVSVVTILGIGFLASSATFVRLPGIKHLSARSDRLYHNGDIAIWTLVECGLGIIASSVAMTKPLVGRMVGIIETEVGFRGDTLTYEAPATNSGAVGKIKPFFDGSNITQVEMTVFDRIETAGSETSILEYP